MQEVHTTLPVGSVIQGRYVIEALLGQGGFGAVYLVRDQRVRGNLFALKEIIDPDEKDRNRFFFEGEVLKQHDHPALPRVYRVFEQQELQRVYLLMDYIEGPNLEQLRGQQPDYRFSLEQVYSILAPVAEVLTYLHSQRPPILHRDIKPANIIIPISGAGAVLVDFGIAKAYDEDTTTTAVRHCSPGYGAPEQYGRGTNIATDIYGLAATCYALLSGMVPIDALTRMTNIGTREFDPLTPLDELVPELPAPITHAIHKALAIKSTARFANVAQFWAAFTLPAVDVGVSTNTSYDTEEVIEQLPFPSEIPPVSVAAVLPQARPSVIIRPVQASAQQARDASQARKKRRALPLLLLLLACLVLITGSLGSLWYIQHHGTLFPLVDQPALLTPTMAASTVGVSTPQVATAVPTKHVVTPTKTAVVSSHPPVVAGSTPISHPTTVPVIQATPTPHLPPPTPTPAPPPPTPIPTPKPFVFPHLVGSYSGVVDDTTATPDIKASMFLSSVKQNQGAISGFFTVNQPLVGSNSFTGSVTTNQHIQFTVSSYNGNAPLLFSGTVQSNGNMSGSYCSIDAKGHCNANVGAAGVWSVCPCASSSIIMNIRAQFWQ